MKYFSWPINNCGFITSTAVFKMQYFFLLSMCFEFFFFYVEGNYFMLTKPTVYLVHRWQLFLITSDVKWFYKTQSRPNRFYNCQSVLKLKSRSSIGWIYVSWILFQPEVSPVTGLLSGGTIPTLRGRLTKLMSSLTTLVIVKQMIPIALVAFLCQPVKTLLRCLQLIQKGLCTNGVSTQATIQWQMQSGEHSMITRWYFPRKWETKCLPGIQRCWMARHHYLPKIHLCTVISMASGQFYWMTMGVSVTPLSFLVTGYVMLGIILLLVPHIIMASILCMTQLDVLLHHLILDWLCISVLRRYKLPCEFKRFGFMIV